MPTDLRRRRILGMAAFGAASLLLPSAALALPATASRYAKLKCLHTGDAFNDVYFENGRYLTDALAEASRVLRDWRTGEACEMDPKLFDALHAIRGRLGVTSPYQIISGYRSPKTNAKLSARSNGVATKSLHMQGKAVDVRLPGVALRDLHKAALAEGAGGVGYYPKSDFVHVDTGRVRRWSGA